MQYKDHLKIKFELPGEMILPEYIDRTYFTDSFFDANIIFKPIASAGLSY